VLNADKEGHVETGCFKTEDYLPAHFFIVAPLRNDQVDLILF